MTTESTLRQRVWKRDGHYWADPLPEEALRETIERSLCFGLYERQPTDTTQTQPPLIGFARGVTDYTTFIYLTDVWVDPKQQGKGLGRWMMQCIQEVIVDMPYLRRSLLFTASWDKSVPFYKEIMDMDVMETKRGQGLAIMERKGRGHPIYSRDAKGY
jgi:GNAT superfamily N-acetyltransferase